LAQLLGAPPVKLAELPGFSPPMVVKLHRPVDGDTAHFLGPGGLYKVRFLWVNTEETHGERATAFGVVAAERMQKWLFESSRIELYFQLAADGSPARDSYGRYLALVALDGELAELRLVREGLSPYYTSFGCAPSPLHEAMLAAEAEAHATARGLWAPGHPTDYHEVFRRWLSHRHCRPDPFSRKP
jgi:endonuclease YncB( thermonuclease family)